MERARGPREKDEHGNVVQGEKGGARVPAAERELDSSGHGGAHRNAQLSLTVVSKMARLLVRRRGGGGGAWRVGNQVEAVRRRRNAVEKVARCSAPARVFPNGTERASGGESSGGRGAGVVL
jgi:hypothetical protein